MLTHRRPHQISLITAIVAVLTVLNSASPAQAQDAYFSIEGQFQNTIDTQSFLFDLTNSVSSAETLYFNTWSHFGGTNAGGDVVAGGGFDPILKLLDSGGISHGVNDDGYVLDPLNPNLDAYLTWLTQAPNPAALTGITTDPLPIDSYEVQLTAFSGSFPSPWAADLVGPASKMTMTGLSAFGGSTVDSMKFGTTGTGTSSAVMNISQLDTLNVANDFFVGKSGKGTLTSLGLINSGLGVLGSGTGSEGSVTLTASGNWLGSADLVIGNSGTGTLLIQSGATGSFQGDAYIAFFGGGQGDVTVRDNNSLLFVGGDLEVGDGGIGTLNIQGGAWVNSSGVGVFGRDAIGDDGASNGTVTVTGSGASGASRWDTDQLLVANNGDGTLNIFAGGRVNSTSAAVGTATVSATGSATVNGTNSLWDIAGALDVGTTQLSIFGNAVLTIENGGTVRAAGATTVNDTGTINLTGSTLRTGSLTRVGTGVFNWTAGTLELTNSDVTLDSFFPDSVLGSTPTIGNGKALILSNAAGLGDLFVAKTGTASMTINGGGNVTANNIYVAYNSTGNAGITVSGTGSTLTVNGDLEVGDGGTGTMRIELGAVVDSSVVGWNGRDVIGNNANGWANGTVDVVDPGSQWRTDNLVVGDGGSGTLNVLAGGSVVSQNVLIGQNNTGTVNIDGSGSLWQLGTLTVGSGPGGPGNVYLTNQAQIQSGSVTVGTNASNGNVTINGFVSGPGLRATWNVTGSMTLGSPGLGRGAVIVEQNGLLNVSNSIDVIGSVDAGPSLTVRTNGEVNVTNTLKVWDAGTVSLLGSQINTGSFIVQPGGTFTHEDGTLTVDGGVFTMELGTLMIDSGGGLGLPTLRLDNGAQGSVEVNLGVTPPGEEGTLYVGRDGRGRMEILRGSRMVSGTGWIAFGTTFPGSGDGEVLVQGVGSRWDITADAGLGAVWLEAFSVGHNGAGTLEIRDGGQVVIHGSDAGIGSPSFASYAGQSGPGTAIVDGAGSLLRVEVGPAIPHSGGNLGIGALDPSTGASGSLTVSNAGRVEVGNVLSLKDAGSLMLASGGLIEAVSFVVNPGGTFTHNDGTLTVNGGTFDPGAIGYTLDGAAPGDLPVVQLINGASASLGGDAIVGGTRRGRLEILSGSTVSLPDLDSVLNIGLPSGSEGEVIVDGSGSSLVTDGGLIVGGQGQGVLRIRNGGSVFDPNSPNEPIAQSPGSIGLVEVSGTAPNGTPSTYSTNGILEVGIWGVGTLRVSGGGHVIARDSATIAVVVTSSDGSSATVDGSGPLGPSTWDVTGSLYVGGDSLIPGGTGTLTVQNGGQVNVSSRLHVWNTGSTSVDPVSRIDVGTGSGLPGKINVLAFGSLSGSGQINADVYNNGGTVRPGTSIGTLAITGNYDQTLTGSLEMELGGTAPSQYDELNPTGSANLAGELVLLIDSLFTPPLYNRFDIINTGQGVFGRFDSVQFPAISTSPSRGLGLIYGPNTVSVSSALMGDLNFDGFVGIADLNIVLVHWNQNVDAAVWPLGDPTGDGFVGVDDLNIILGNWNAGTPPSGATVPEPGSVALLGVGMVIMLRRVA